MLLRVELSAQDAILAFVVLTYKLSMNYENYDASCAITNPRPPLLSGKLFGYREGASPYKWISWTAGDRQIQDFRSGLVQLGLQGE